MSKEHIVFILATAAVLALILFGPTLFSSIQQAYAICTIIVGAVVYCSLSFEEKE